MSTVKGQSASRWYTQGHTMVAPLPTTELERLRALHRYKILDTPVEEPFERLTRLGAQLFGVPIVLISLVDKERQWFKSCYGLDLRETDRNVSFCAHALFSDEVMVVPDAMLDERFADNPFVTEFPHIRFYAGAPLRTPDGHNLGTLCVMNTEPRVPLTESEKKNLADLAALVVDELELRQSLETAAQELDLRQKVEEKLREANLELEHANCAKAEFLANTSHELRTPLTAIIGFSELLVQEAFGPLNEIQTQYVNDIYESGEHLLALINDILDLSKIEAGKMELRLEPVDVTDLVRAALSVVRERAQRNGLTLEVSVTESVGELLADARKVKQALLNLLSNAVKFTPSGGRVQIMLEGSPDEVCVEVRDTGVGIAEADQARLFRAFSQLEASGKSNEGTGLGLVLTKRLIELHGGRVWVESAPGVGSTFGFTLPRERPVQETD